VTNGAVFGLMPIGWIVFAAICSACLWKAEIEIIKDSIGGLPTTAISGAAHRLRVRGVLEAAPASEVPWRWLPLC
jgi:hypothetical protein